MLLKLWTMEFMLNIVDTIYNKLQNLKKGILEPFTKYCLTKNL